jgi:hypothetical protein
MPARLSVIAKRHAYSTHAFIRVCPRHGSISQEDEAAKAHRFEDVDAAVGFLSVRHERVDRFQFFFVNERNEIVGEAFKSDYSI